ncbi:Nuc-1 negative regulatory protein preg [Smittium culicis]|uniref:Nuc-1 negative regulatory protein preg n=1 Tax=Smittium culicis TaxID=133412 RepID=A0A1R1YSD0_9FUNG|nr:Nuc-1 negative regulatory protein preg [Smittium culicis]
MSECLKVDDLTLLSDSYHNVNKDILVALVSKVLERVIEENEKLQLSTPILTRFHSQKPPGISVQNYLERIVKYTALEPVCLLLLLVYADRISRFKQNHFVLNSLTVHRFIISAITVSAKAMCDVYCTNSHYAKVGGVSTRELCFLELALVDAIGWQLMSPHDSLLIYYRSLVQNSGIYTTSPQFNSQKHKLGSRSDSSIDSELNKRVALGS